MSFYILLRGEVKGPFPIGMIREMLTAGAIQDITLAAPEGEKEWRPVGILLNESPHDTDVAGKSVLPTSNNNGMPAKPRTWHASRNAKIAAALAIGIGVFFLRGRDEITKNVPPEATDEAQAPGTDSSGRNYEPANRIAAQKFKNAWQIAIRANQSGRPDASAVNILAAVKNTDWSQCSPELRNAVMRLSSTDANGNMTMGEFKENLIPFMKICQRYIDF